MLSLKLLVVKDDAASLELMTEVLGSLEAEVRPISDSQKAAVLVNQEKFDGIFARPGAANPRLLLEQIDPNHYCYWTGRARHNA